MSASLREFIANMKKANTCELASRAVDQLLALKSPQELAKILTAVERSEAIDDETLGYYVFPGLQRKLTEDKALLKEVVKLIKQSDLSEKFIMHCIALLANHYRKTEGPTQPAEFVNFIRDVSADERIRSAVRAYAARLLTRIPEKNRQGILEVLIASDDAQLIEAACHTIARWSRSAQSEHQDLLGQLLAYVQRAPHKALDHPQILRAVALMDQRRADVAFEGIMAHIRSKKDVVRLAACLGPGRSSHLIAEMIGVARTSGPEGRQAIRHLIRREPALLDLLYQGEHYQDLVEVVKTEPTSFGAAAIDYLELIQAAEGVPAQAAAKLKREITSVRYNAFLSSEHLHRRKNRSAAAFSTPPGSTLRHGTQKQPLFAAYSTGFNMGDALYRDTHLLDPFCHNHWHAGLFQAFQLDSTNAGFQGVMRGVHMTGFPGAIASLEAKSDDFTLPQCEVAAAMKNLYDNFMKEFMVDPKHPFHGARQTPVMSKSDRLNLVQKSEELTQRSIYFTFADMLDWHGTQWSGDMDDIDNLRCDGVVEYTYEACGKKVCAGTQAANWNIAAPGNQHPESHADLHTWDLNEGELCPKVQAGAEGNDTTFIPSQPSVPEVTEFAIHEEALPNGNVVVIKFNVKSENYYGVYVRMLVGAEGGPFDFVTTVAMDDSGFAGQWRFIEVDAGTNHFAYWPKDPIVATLGGNGANLEFRLVAVDKGGNVSTEYFSRLPVN